MGKGRQHWLSSILFGSKMNEELCKGRPVQTKVINKAEGWNKNKWISASVFHCVRNLVDVTHGWITEGLV